jgi:hypothetical protein
VPTATDYRIYARECIESARAATSEEVRKQFLDLAKLWMTAAEKADHPVPVNSETFQRPDGPAPGKQNGTLCNESC